LGKDPGYVFSISQTSRPRLYGFGKVALPLPCGQTESSKNYQNIYMQVLHGMGGGVKCKNEE